MDALDPSLFIGSSSEGLPIAHALQAELDKACEPLVWSQGAFGPTGTTIGSLLEVAQSSDFAALVLTPDDPVVTRGAEVITARDNVVFELGLFLGALGPRRVFIIRPRDLNLTLPSDLAGVTLLDYRNRSDHNLQAAIGPVATRIREIISSEGPRRELLQPDQEAARFWLKYGRKVPEAKDAARRLLAHLPERTGRTLERLSGSLDKDLMVSSFRYIARDAGGAEYPERAVLMARRSWASPKGPARLGVGLGQSVNPDPHSEFRRPFCGIYAADQEVLDRLREFCGPSDALWHPWAQWDYLSLDPPDERGDLLTHFATAVAEHARLSWEENIRILDQVIGHSSLRARRALRIVEKLAEFFGVGPKPRFRHLRVWPPRCQRKRLARPGILVEPGDQMGMQVRKRITQSLLGRVRHPRSRPPADRARSHRCRGQSARARSRVVAAGRPGAGDPSGRRRPCPEMIHRVEPSGTRTAATGSTIGMDMIMRNITLGGA